MPTRVLVTGASGLLGRAVYERLHACGYDLMGTAYSRDQGGKLRLLDMCDHVATKELVTKFNPDAIVHCAAERRPDNMENDEEKSRQLNVTATRNLAEVARSLGAWVLYISSDYVFDGTKPPYQEDALRTNPLNKYGRSKLDGELECLAVSEGNAVLRIPVLYGRVERLDESSLTVLFQNVLKTDQKCVMSDYELRYPTSVDDLAIVISQMIEKRQNLRGYFHWSGSEEMTKYDMSIVMATLFDLPTDHIVADKNASGGAPRPYNAKLECKRLEEFGIGHRTSFKTGIKHCLQPWAKRNTVKVKIHVD